MPVSAARSAAGRPPRADRADRYPGPHVLAQTYPTAEIMLTGVKEPRCLAHAPNERVDLAEIEHMALAEALFLANYPTSVPQSGG